MRAFSAVFLVVLACSLFTSRPAVAAASEPDPVMGIYEGFWKTLKGGPNGRVTMQLRPLGDGQYDGFLTLHRAKAMTAAVKLQGAAPVDADGALKLAGRAVSGAGGDLMPSVEIQVSVRNGKATGSFNGEVGAGEFDAQRVRKKSPTLGQKPPSRAVVLFDGKDTSRWQSFPWEITPERGMRITKGDIKAKEKFVNYRLHVEFKTPLMPKARGQGRGNSGVYLQSKYEVQVLDSFGLFPLQDNDCAGIYKVVAPSVNASLPPLEWQTYDITFVEGNEAQKTPPVVTVSLNGVTVVEHVRIPLNLMKDGTGGGDKDGACLKLQDHGNPVEFRNIWIEPFYSALRMRGQ